MFKRLLGKFYHLVVSRKTQRDQLAFVEPVDLRVPLLRSQGRAGAAALPAESRDPAPSADSCRSFRMGTIAATDSTIYHPDERLVCR